MARWTAVLALALLLAAPVPAQELPPPTQSEVPTPPGAEPRDEGDEAGEWEMVEAIVAWINDDIITTSEMADAEQQLSAELYRQLTGEELETALEETRRDLLYRLIEQRLLVQKAEQMYDMEKLQQSLLDQVKKQQGIETEEQLSELLRQAGMTKDELMRTLVENNTPTWIIQAEVTDTISVSDEEIAVYFEAHKAELGEVPRVTFREIVLLNEGKDKSEVAARARSVVSDARSGVDFAELVSAMSESPSREGGGRVGPLAQADLAPWLSGPAFALAEGEVSDPIETPYGWQVIRVEERSEGAEPELESLRGEIENRVRQEKFEPALGAFISELWTSSEIIIAKDWVHRLPPAWQGKVLQR